MENKHYGHLEVICGPMFAGKTTEILKRVLWARNGCNQKVKVFKPAFDNRYSETEIVSHDGLRTIANSIYTWDELAEYHSLVVFDEIQFFVNPHFDRDIVKIIAKLLQNGTNVVASGLDMDWQGNPFYTTSMLLGMADEVKKLKANCTISGRPAGKTFKKTQDGGSVELGAHDLYEARSNEFWSFK